MSVARQGQAILQEQLHLQEQCHCCQDPLSCLLFGLQVKSPDIGGSSDTCFVHGAFINVFGLHSVHRNGLDEDDGHDWGQILQPCFSNDSGLGIPASSCGDNAAEYLGALGRLNPWFEVLTVNKGSTYRERPSLPSLFRDRPVNGES